VPEVAIGARSIGVIWLELALETVAGLVVLLVVALATVRIEDGIKKRGITINNNNLIMSTSAYSMIIDPPQIRLLLCYIVLHGYHNSSCIPCFYI
jgi:hypothetical protein